MPHRAIVIARNDYEKLRRLVYDCRVFGRVDGDRLDLLEAELDRARIVSASRVPDGVITMNSTVVVEDLDSGRHHLYELVLPREANIDANKISVLAPIGTALLGYREGDSIEWKVPGGTRRLKIKRVTQPVKAIAA